jgi:hypothetical protein
MSTDRYPKAPQPWAFRRDVAELLFELRETISEEDEECYAFNTLIIFTSCFRSQLGFQWYTTEEIVGLWKQRVFTDDELMGQLSALEEDWGITLTPEFLDAFFEQYKGVERYGYVLMRTSTKPYRWGVIQAEEYTNEQARIDDEQLERAREDFEKSREVGDPPIDPELDELLYGRSQASRKPHTR